MQLLIPGIGIATQWLTLPFCIKQGKALMHSSNTIAYFAGALMTMFGFLLELKVIVELRKKGFSIEIIK